MAWVHDENFEDYEDFKQAFNGPPWTQPCIDPDLAERLYNRDIMLEWIREYYPRIKAQQKKNAPGQKHLF